LEIVPEPTTTARKESGGVTVFPESLSHPGKRRSVKHVKKTAANRYTNLDSANGTSLSHGKCGYTASFFSMEILPRFEDVKAINSDIIAY